MMPRSLSNPTVLPDVVTAILETAPDALLLIDATGVIRYANGTAETMLGYPVEGLIGECTELLVPEELRASHARHRADYARDRRTRPMGPDLDLMLRRAGGEALPVDIRLAPLSVGGEPMVLAAVRDATERRRAERERGELIGRLERTRERERIAGDLHDDIIQSVYAVGLDLQAAGFDERLSKDQVIDRAVTELKAVISDLRAYMDYLRGARDAHDVHDDADIFTTRVRSLLRAYSGGPRWHGEFAIARPLDARISRELFLVAKELVSNAVRHAYATEASITVEHTGDGLMLRVEDDGVGFDVDEVREGAFGLANLRQRLAGLNARLSIESSPGEGTVVVVCVPID